MSWRDRILADSVLRDEWRAARAHVIGGSDAAGLSKLESLPLYLASKLSSDIWQGNAFTAHGNQMEPGLLGYAGFEQNTFLVHAEGEPGFAATPDGIRELADGTLELAEVKTTNKPFKTIPLRYRRQVWWAQYVLGAERTKFIWLEHDDFELSSIDPHVVTIDRDEDQIQHMLNIATPLLAAMRAALQFEQETAA